MGFRTLLRSFLIGASITDITGMVMVEPALCREECHQLAHDNDEVEIKSIIISDPCVKRYSLKRIIASRYQSFGNYSEARRWYQLALEQLTSEGFNDSLGPSSQKLPVRHGDEIVWQTVTLTEQQKRDAVNAEIAVLKHFIAEIDRRSRPPH